MPLRILTLILTLGFCAAVAQEDTPISSIEELRNLSIDQAAKKLPVEIEAQITRVSPTHNSIYLHDGKVGCYVALQTIDTRQLALKPGQLILVKGHSNPYSFFPHLEAISIQPRGEAPLPEPVSLTGKNMFASEMDCAWVTTRGKVLGVGDKEGKDIFTISILSLGERIELHLPNTIETDKFARSLINTKIEVTGVLSTDYNDKRQLTSRYIGVPAPHYIRTTSPQLQQEIPLIPLEEVRKIDAPRAAPLRVRGIITYHDHSRVVIQLDGKGLLLHTTTPCIYERGDLVEAIGLVSPEAFTTALKAQSFSLIETSEVPAPIRIYDLQEIDRADLDNAFVAITAEILEERIALSGSVITCSVDGKLFQVGFPLSWSNLKHITRGATADITGIFQQVSATSPLTPTDPKGFQLLVMKASDVKILRRPGWWTLNRVLSILALVGTVLFIALTWVWLLRRKVAEQTNTIRSQVAQESSAQERERVARELHDSLEQNLSAVAFQIDNVIRFYNNEKFDKLGPALDVTKKMAKACQRESREAIYDLRGSDEEAAAWRDEMLLSEAERLGAEIKLKISGKSYSLEADSKRQLRRIVREATYNSLRHGKATEVLVEYDYEPNLFTAHVRDNGSGFDTKGARPEGHFGLAGMEERAGRIGAKFILESEPGSGTTVSIQLPVHRNLS